MVGALSDLWSNRGVVYASRSRRTVANAVIVEGFFAFMWFGWGQEGPPAWESLVLAVGAVLAVLVAVAGIVSARQAQLEPPPLADQAAGRRYGIIVGTEFASCGIGAAVLGVTGHGEFIAAWICFVVGVHFVPLDRVFPGIGMVGLGVVVVLVAVAAAAVGALTEVLPSSVAGLGAGACLLGHASTLLSALHLPRPRLVTSA
jgi:hypothetical protein